MNSEMNCETAKPILMEYLMGEAAPEVRNELERHLRACESCSEEMAELKQTLSLVQRTQVSEDIPRRIRIVAEPQPVREQWYAFWRIPSQAALAASALLFLSVISLALFHTTISYGNGNVRISLGAPAVSSGAPSSLAVPAAATSGALDRAQVMQMISQAIENLQADQQKQQAQLAKAVSSDMQQRLQRDLGDMGERLRYFQAAQTMMWKEQVEDQQRMSDLIRQAGMTSPAQQ